MNKNNFEDRVNEDIERTDQGENDPEVDTNSGVLANLVQATPTGQGVIPVGPAAKVVVHEASVDEMRHSNIPEVATIAPATVTSMNTGSVAALLNHEESEHFRILWNEIQSRFVDEPRSAVQQADALVSDVIEKITRMFANEHSSLEVQWKEGKDVSTEDLRKALQHYRSFFNRLVV